MDKKVISVLLRGLEYIFSVSSQLGCRGALAVFTRHLNFEEN